VFVLDPVSPSTIYVSTPPSGPPTAPGVPPKGTTLKSTNGGNSWTAIDSGLPSSGFMSFLAIDPVTPSTLYAVFPSFTEPAGPALFKSMDGGQTWAALGAFRPILR
jgi:hypothetical protein